MLNKKINDAIEVGNILFFLKGTKRDSTISNEIRDEMVEGDRNDCDFFSLVSFPGFVDFDGFKT